MKQKRREKTTQKENQARKRKPKHILPSKSQKEHAPKYVLRRWKSIKVQHLITFPDRVKSQEIITPHGNYFVVPFGIFELEN